MYFFSPGNLKILHLSLSHPLKISMAYLSITGLGDAIQLFSICKMLRNPQLLSLTDIHVIHQLYLVLHVTSNFLRLPAQEKIIVFFVG